MIHQRYINLPIGTVIQGVTTTSSVPLFESQILGVTVDSSNNVQILTNSGTSSAPGTCTIATGSAMSALSFKQQIMDFLGSDQQGSFTPIIYVDTTPTFSSISFIDTFYTVSGSNFILSGINASKFDDGVGDVVINPSTSVQNDTTIVIPGDLSVPGVYTLYYSTDGGATYHTTGLTTTY